MRPQSLRRVAVWAVASTLALPVSLLVEPQAGAAPRQAASASSSHEVTGSRAATSAKKPTMRSLRAALRDRFTAYPGSKPATANPSLALFPPGVHPDYQAWAAHAKRLSKARERSARHLSARAKGPLDGLTYAEQEGAGERGFNDDSGTAEVISGFGTGEGEQAAGTILGTMSPAKPGRYTKVAPSKENDGSLRRARDLGVARKFPAARTTGFRGDAPGGERARKNDVDFYRLRLSAGQVLKVEMAATSGNLRPVLVLFDPDRNFLAFSQEFGSMATLQNLVSKGGTYYLISFGWNNCVNPTTRQAKLDSDGRQRLGMEILKRYKVKESCKN